MDDNYFQRNLCTKSSYSNNEDIVSSPLRRFFPPKSFSISITSPELSIT